MLHGLAGKIEDFAEEMIWGDKKPPQKESVLAELNELKENLKEYITLGLAGELREPEIRILPQMIGEYVWLVKDLGEKWLTDEPVLAGTEEG